MSTLNKNSSIKCFRCNVPLEEGKCDLSYLGFKSHFMLPRCPKCGQVYISEELAKGKVRKAEFMLEEK